MPVSSCHIRRSRKPETICGLFITDNLYVTAERFVYPSREGKIWCTKCKEIWNTDYNNWNKQLE